MADIFFWMRRVDRLLLMWILHNFNSLLLRRIINDVRALSKVTTGRHFVSMRLNSVDAVERKKNGWVLGQGLGRRLLDRYKWCWLTVVTKTQFNSRRLRLRLPITALLTHPRGRLRNNQINLRLAATLTIITTHSTHPIRLHSIILLLLIGLLWRQTNPPIPIETLTSTVQLLRLEPVEYECLIELVCVCCLDVDDFCW